jgi:hypothetical protein
LRGFKGEKNLFTLRLHLLHTVVVANATAPAASVFESANASAIFHAEKKIAAVTATVISIDNYFYEFCIVQVAHKSCKSHQKNGPEIRFYS